MTVKQGNKVAGLRFDFFGVKHDDYVGPITGGLPLGLQNDGAKRVDLEEVQVEVKITGRGRDGYKIVASDTLLNLVLHSQYDSSIYDYARYGDRWESTDQDGEQIYIPIEYMFRSPICLGVGEELVVDVSCSSDTLPGGDITFGQWTIDGATQGYVKSQDGVPFLDKKESQFLVEAIKAHESTEELHTYHTVVLRLDSNTTSPQFDLPNNVVCLDVLDLTNENPNLTTGEISKDLLNISRVNLSGRHFDQTWDFTQLVAQRARGNKNYVEMFLRKSHYRLWDNQNRDLDGARISMSIKPEKLASSEIYIIYTYYSGDANQFRKGMAKIKQNKNNYVAKSLKPS